ncbi:MAG TPA: hypothetical protein VMW48_02390, partial [Vicinamibacterales bacterium]|nr:hypothetical protein [Vicinamibacterales bacterium]
MKIDAAWLDTHEWMLRSSDNGVSYGGFKWKRRGAWTKCKKWSATPTCGNGLHGNAPEAHGYGLDYGTIDLCETRGPRIVIGGDKIKVREARVVARNADIPVEA